MNHSLQSHRETTPDVSAHPARTALVLGGGGSTGNAWLIGVIAGLHEAGLDVTDADLTVGTSAGATAAAQIAGAGPGDLYTAALAPMSPRPPRPVRPAGDAGSSTGSGSGGADGPTGTGRLTVNHLARLQATIAEADSIDDLRRRMGRLLEADPASSPQAGVQWRATVAARLPRNAWPDRRVLITAVDATNGEPVVFDRGSGVDLVDAVAASCAGGFAYRIGEGRFIDGGYRSNAENADLAVGYERVLVLSPLGGRSLHPFAWGTHLSTQVDALRAEGSLVQVVVPDPAFEHLFGANAMVPSLRPDAARAGYQQGSALAEALAGHWR
ncbi:NTE family protein [Agromyces sp. CF514]|uniref:patatin-like phospholipase family protein n=1 Tax=Agromyces sp. CF514 TaxID=1881031 RepID=UPI0008F35C52|nr:patatin-like phospholipase family protein [Agromyces sp. CF514]SFR77844.1 NTE family protein [Agromyces sp. CF514]